MANDAPDHRAGAQVGSWGRGRGYARATVEEKFEDRRIAKARGQMNGSGAQLLAFGIHIRAALNRDPGDVDAALRGGGMQRRPHDVVGFVDLSAGIEKPVHGRDIIGADGIMELRGDEWVGRSDP